MKFAYLGSGSRGNAALVESEGTCLMIDCGFSVRETRRRMALLERTPHDVDALLVTHEHGDHASGVAALARRYGMRVYMTAGTLAGCRDAVIPGLRRLNAHAPLTIGAFEVTPVPVPHDAREPCQFVLSAGGVRLGILTDTGRITRHIEAAYRDCDTLLLECNHDPDMLDSGPYPPALKRRVGGSLGHLNNGQAASLLDALGSARPRRVLAVHVSEKNNTPALASAALGAALGCDPEAVPVVAQDDVLPWQDVTVQAPAQA